jgi:hypothetical protein
MITFIHAGLVVVVLLRLAQCDVRGVDDEC